MDEAPPPPPNSPAAHPNRPDRPRKRSGARLLLGISLMGLLTLGAATAGLLFFARDGMPSRGTVGGFLEVDVDSSLADAPGDVGLSFDPKDFPALLTDVTDDIRRAANDDRIKGL